MSLTAHCQLSIQKPQTRLDWPPTRLPSRGNSDCAWPVVLPRRHGKLNGSRCWSLPTFVLLRKQRSLAKVNVTTPTIDLRCRASLKRSSLGFERPYWETMITRWLSSALLSPLLLLLCEILQPFQSPRPENRDFDAARSKSINGPFRSRGEMICHFLFRNLRGWLYLGIDSGHTPPFQWPCEKDKGAHLD